MQRSDDVSAQDGFASGVRSAVSTLLINVSKGVEPRLKPFDTLQVMRDDFLRVDLFVPDAPSELNQRKVMKSRHDVLKERVSSVRGAAPSVKLHRRKDLTRKAKAAKIDIAT
jgi:hypothetical protein